MAFFINFLALDQHLNSIKITKKDSIHKNNKNLIDEFLIYLCYNFIKFFNISVKNVVVSILLCTFKKTL